MTNTFDWWAQDARLAADGEMAVNPLPPPPIKVGVTIRSKSIIYADSNFEVSGVVVDGPLPVDDVEMYRVVEQYRGRILYHLIAVDDIDYSPGAYSGTVRKDVLRSLARAMHRDSAANPRADHLAALLRLSAALGDAT